MLRYIFFAVLWGLSACSVIKEKPTIGFNLAQMQHLQHLERWYFEGRVALSNEKDSISAAINWRHNLEKDEIELSGPLSQGKVAIVVTADKVIVDDGEHPQEFEGQVDDVVSGQLGVNMPVSALKYWVLGVNQPLQPVILQDSGFVQDGWQVAYREMQNVDSELLPKKIFVDKNKTRIKLIIDQWKLL
jgi:outer membrane lipoprotein LolB